MKKIIVSKEGAGLRLDVYLTTKVDYLSRSWIQKLIREEKVKLNDKPARSSQKLKAGDKVSGGFDLPPEISLEPDPAPGKNIEVVFENDDFLVIDKPAGLVVHPSSATPSGTLVNWLIWKYPEIKNVGESELRPGVVHRLDKDTSGLMVIAKNQNSFGWLKAAFQKREVRKRYYALVAGVLEKDEGIISYPIGRSSHDPTHQIAYLAKNKIPLSAKQAITEWRVVKRYAGFTFLELTPKTGRMHQLRVHLKAIGHPVAGDEKYGSRPLAPKNLGRMFLHSFGLSFENPRGEKFSFSAPLPADLEIVLKNLPYVVK